MDGLGDLFTSPRPTADFQHYTTNSGEPLCELLC